MSDGLILSQASAGALPVFSLQVDTRQHAEALAARTSKLTINSAEDFKAAAADLNQLTKNFNLIDGIRLERVREWNESRDLYVNTPARPLLDALSVAKAHVQAQLSAWDQAEQKRIVQARLEQEQQREKAHALEAEAQRRQEVAADKVEAATDEQQFEAAGHAFDRGLAVAGQAKELASASIAAPLPKAIKARGVAKGMEVQDLLITDLSKLPLTYHEANETKIKKHILDGTLDENTPGISYRLAPKFRGTGRG
jgi:hypothetical protein